MKCDFKYYYHEHLRIHVHSISKENTKNNNFM